MQKVLRELPDSHIIITAVLLVCWLCGQGSSLQLLQLPAVARQPMDSWCPDNAIHCLSEFMGASLGLHNEIRIITMILCFVIMKINYKQ